MSTLTLTKDPVSIMTDRTAVTIVFRVETKGDNAGTVLAVFSGEAGTSRPGYDAQAFDANNGHYTIDRGWYESDTRPATSEEVWRDATALALSLMGYDVTTAKRMVWA